MKIPVSGPDTIDRATRLVNHVLRTASLSVGSMTVHSEQEMGRCIGAGRAPGVGTDATRTGEEGS